MKWMSSIVLTGLLSSCVSAPSISIASPWDYYYQENLIVVTAQSVTIKGNKLIDIEFELSEFYKNEDYQLVDFNNSATIGKDVLITAYFKKDDLGRISFFKYNVVANLLDVFYTIPDDIFYNYDASSTPWVFNQTQPKDSQYFCLGGCGNFFVFEKSNFQLVYVGLEREPFVYNSNEVVFGEYVVDTNKFIFVNKATLESFELNINRDNAPKGSFSSRKIIFNSDDFYYIEYKIPSAYTIFSYIWARIYKIDIDSLTANFIGSAQDYRVNGIIE